MSEWNDYSQNQAYKQNNNRKRRNKRNKRYNNNNNNNYNDQYYGQQQQQQHTYNNNYSPYQEQQYPQYGQQQQQQHQYDESVKQKQKAEYIEIDGSIMEGGGQILRNSISLSALLSKPISIINIRGKRSKPGLAKQHSKGIELVRQINGGYVQGNYIKSMQVQYSPNHNKNKKNENALADFYIDIETAGACCLLMQTALPLLLYSPNSSPCTLTIIGGTNALFAPQIDWFILVLQPMLKKLMNIEIDVRCLQRGFFPKGGGKVVLKTKPIIGCIPAFDLTKRGKIVNFHGCVVIAGRNMPLHIGKYIVAGAVRELQMTFGVDTAINIEILAKNKVESYSAGTGIVIVCETDSGCLFGGSSLGKQTKNNNFNQYEYEKVGRAAARELISDLQSTKQGCTDRRLQDQLIIFMALARGKSRMYSCALELHTKTAIYIAKLMTGAKFKCSQINDGTVLIECQGIGYKGNAQGHAKENIKVEYDDDQKEKVEKKENVQQHVQVLVFYKIVRLCFD